MLSKQEKRAFAEIAEQVAVADPRFAASMRRLQSRRPRGHDVVVMLAAASALLCLLLGLAGPCLAAATLAFFAHRLRPRRPARRPLRRRRRPRRPSCG